MAQPHTTVGGCGMLWTRLLLADTSFGQDVPQPIGHQHRRTRHSTWTHETIDTGWMGPGSEDDKVTTKLHGPFCGLHQDDTLAESVAFWR